jgi:hypothetical protein
MSEANPIGRTDDPDAVESPRPSSAEADQDSGYGPRSAADQVDIDAQEADEIAARLSSER